MRRTRIALALVFGSLVLAVVSRAGADGSPAGFRLQDASAACRLEGDAIVVCRSLAVRQGVALGRRGEPRAAREPIWWDAATPVRDEWQHAGIQCRATAGELVCVNEAGAAISAGPAGIAAAL